MNSSMKLRLPQSRRPYILFLFVVHVLSVNGLLPTPRPSTRTQKVLMTADDSGSWSFKPRFAVAAVIISTGLMMGVSSTSPEPANAVPLQVMKFPVRVLAIAARDAKEMYSNKQSPGWELARQKRTAAVKLMQDKGILQIDTDDAGNQFLKLPWIPDHRVKYKSLSLTQRLSNEVCAGAFGELSKDVLLHAVDTAKTRKQAQKKAALSTGVLESVPIETVPPSIGSAISGLKDLYGGFPVVLMSSIPQGGVFFFVKKGCVELINMVAPGLPTFVSSTVPIGFGVMAYWLFRTPAEVIKTQVQTGQSPNVREAFENAKNGDKGLISLWKYYPVMLSLDIPFQIINFILFGFVSDAVLHAGYDTSVWTRLFCGITCGMVSAAITCPVDVCKTRIVARDREASNQVSPEFQIVTGEPKAPVEETEDSLLLAQLLSQELDISDTLRAKRRTIMEEIEVYDRDRASDFEGSTTIILPLSAQEQLIKKADMISQLIISLEQKQEGKRMQIEKQVQVEYDVNFNSSPNSDTSDERSIQSNNVVQELFKIIKEEGVGTLFLGIKQRLVYVGLANGIRLAAYGTSRMDLMMRSLDDL
jgi:solute carrier family 25 (mitochondrial S-adenosylmethionine transporter), member 26